jgi:predicted nucleotidyltransferase
MLEALISSKTRIKLLLKFFLNSSTTAYLRNLETEFGESTNGIRVELNRFEETGLLTSFTDGNKKMFRANTGHPLFDEIRGILLKYVGFDKIIETVIDRLGNVEKVYVAGGFAKGLDGPIVDLIFVGDLDKQYLLNLVEKAEPIIQRKIRYLIYMDYEFSKAHPEVIGQDLLLLWAR